MVYLTYTTINTDVLIQTLVIVHLCSSNDTIVTLIRCNVLNRKEVGKEKRIVTSIVTKNSLYVADYYAASS